MSNAKKTGAIETKQDAKRLVLKRDTVRHLRVSTAVATGSGGVTAASGATKSMRCSIGVCTNTVTQ